MRVITATLGREAGESRPEDAFKCLQLKPFRISSWPHHRASILWAPSFYFYFFFLSLFLFLLFSVWGLSFVLYPRLDLRVMNTAFVSLSDILISDSSWSGWKHKVL